MGRAWTGFRPVGNRLPGPLHGRRDAPRPPLCQQLPCGGGGGRGAGPDCRLSRVPQLRGRHRGLVCVLHVGVLVCLVGARQAILVSIVASLRAVRCSEYYGGGGDGGGLWCPKQCDDPAASATWCQRQASNSARLTGAPLARRTVYKLVFANWDRTRFQMSIN